MGAPSREFFLLPGPLIGSAKKLCYTCGTSAITVERIRGTTP